MIRKIEKVGRLLKLRMLLRSTVCTHYTYDSLILDRNPKSVPGGMTVHLSLRRLSTRVSREISNSVCSFIFFNFTIPFAISSSPNTTINGIPRSKVSSNCFLNFGLSWWEYSAGMFAFHSNFATFILSEIRLDPMDAINTCQN
jgi:hypothetical protein